ncbi:MAG TPA: FAD binding domain-containing protein [Burkholderiales bacterium]|jgi:CO/xanthine dehydrogenase FAD-binding subunit|nr:FAD binding domain-containing protein [Burkholderiales bacterium]
MHISAASAAQYLQPTALGDVLAALADAPYTVLAGGTDFYPGRVGKPVDDVALLDITRVAGLSGISRTAEGWRIGATTTWSEVIRAPLPAVFDGLKAAAREVGGAQIQNSGTVAGNLCNASPAADGVPPLLALGAEVELASTLGTRRLPLSQFIFGNRKTARAAHELVTAILVPAWPEAARSSFIKLGTRKYLVISIVMGSAVVALDEAGRIARCGLAVGACSAAALSLDALARKLVGRTPAQALKQLAPEDLQGLAPINDVRGSAAYRIEAAFTLVGQVLTRAFEQAEGKA